MTEALWQEIEPIGLRAFPVEPGSFRTGIEQRTHFSGEPIEAYDATSGAFRKMMTTVTPDMSLGGPRERRATKDRAKLDILRAEFEAGADTARSTDYPGNAKAIL